MTIWVRNSFLAADESHPSTLLLLLLLLLPSIIAPSSPAFRKMVGLRNIAKHLRAKYPSHQGRYPPPLNGISGRIEEL